MQYVFTETMMETLALAIQHNKLTENIVVMTFHPGKGGTTHTGTLVLDQSGATWHAGNFQGKSDIIMNMTGDEEVLKRTNQSLSKVIMRMLSTFRDCTIY
jgi:hypothetical protein